MRFEDWLCWNCGARGHKVSGQYKIECSACDVAWWNEPALYKNLAVFDAKKHIDHSKVKLASPG